MSCEDGQSGKNLLNGALGSALNDNLIGSIYNVAILFHVLLEGL